MVVSIHSGVLVARVLVTKTLLFGVYIRARIFSKIRMTLHRSDRQVGVRIQSCGVRDRRLSGASYLESYDLFSVFYSRISIVYYMKRNDIGVSSYASGGLGEEGPASN